MKILEDYLSTNTHRLLIVCTDEVTSIVQIHHSISSNFDLNHGLYYFIRKTDSSDQIESVSHFLRSVRFGYLTGKAIPCLTAIISALVGPLFTNNNHIQDRTSEKIV